MKILPTILGFVTSILTKQNFPNQPSIRIYLSIAHQNLFPIFFPQELESRISHLEFPAWLNWLKHSLSKYDRFDLVSNDKSINPYSILSHISSLIPENSTVVCADSTACVVSFQVFHIKNNQRLFHNSGCASMGYEIPASIGAFYSTNKPIFCIAGDGSIMMNIQELAIINELNLPLSFSCSITKVIVLFVKHRKIIS